MTMTITLHIKPLPSDVAAGGELELEGWALDICLFGGRKVLVLKAGLSKPLQQFSPVDSPEPGSSLVAAAEDLGK